MNILFHTLGCKVNQYETEVMREALLNLGHTNDKSLQVDAIIINSCTVTAESDRKTRQLVRRMRRQYPDAVITLTGCMVQAFPDEVYYYKDKFYGIYSKICDNEIFYKDVDEIINNGIKVC